MKKYIAPFFLAFFGAIMGVMIYNLLFPQKNTERSQQVSETKYVYYKQAEIERGIKRSDVVYNPVDFTLAAAESTPSVVNIRSESKAKGFYWIGGSEETVSTGSGVIISSDGYIVTNNHVIEGGEKFTISLADNREYKANLVGTDVSTDLALLKINGENLPYCSFGNSDSLLVGAWVIAVGNPFNLESTVTAGIVSAKGRKIDILEGEFPIESFIQTDAVVNPGNSGGALVNTDGELIGINTAIITKSGKYEGYSFAVPSNLVKKVINDIKNFGSVQRGLMGVSLATVSNRDAKKLKLEKIQGVIIERVNPSSGAEVAGLKKGDVIFSINGKEVKTLPELQEIVATFSPGDKIEIGYLRGGKRLLTKVELSNHSINLLDLSAIETEDLKIYGFEVENLNAEQILQYGKDGIIVPLVVENSKAFNAGIVAGYIVTHVNEKRIYSRAEFIEELNQSKSEVFISGFYPDFEGEFHYRLFK
jgi:serine protease Do